MPEPHPNRCCAACLTLMLDGLLLSTLIKSDSSVEKSCPSAPQVLTYLFNHLFISVWSGRSSF